VRGRESYFRDIPKEDIPKEMLALTAHIIGILAQHFQPRV
jgi:non-homologous end joining protein Ku